MSEETKEYPFDVKFDESAFKTFNDLIKEKGIRHFKLESDLYGILDVVPYEEYKKLQQKVEQLEKENKKLNNIINGMEKFFKYEFDNEVRPLNSYKISVWTICLDKLKELKEDNKNV